MFSRTAFLCILGVAFGIKCLKQLFIASHVLHVEAAIVTTAVLEATPKRVSQEAAFGIIATLGWVGIKAAIVREDFSLPLGAPLAIVGAALQVTLAVVAAVAVTLVQ